MCAAIFGVLGYRSMYAESDFNQWPVQIGGAPPILYRLILKSGNFRLRTAVASDYCYDVMRDEALPRLGFEPKAVRD